MSADGDRVIVPRSAGVSQVAKPCVPRSQGIHKGAAALLWGEPAHDACQRLLLAAQRAVGVGGTRPPRLSPGGGNGKGGVQIPCCRRLFPFEPDAWNPPHRWCIGAFLSGSTLSGYGRPTASGNGSAPASIPAPCPISGSRFAVPGRSA